MWDLGGQADLRELWYEYSADAHAVLFLVDSSDSARFPECREEIIKLFSTSNLDQAALMIAVNKRDVAGSVDVANVLLALDLPPSVTEVREMTAMGCVASTSAGISEIFEWLTQTIPSSDRDALIRQRKISTQTTKAGEIPDRNSAYSVGESSAAHIDTGADKTIEDSSV